MKVVDAVGLYCPEPVFRARRAMEEAEEGELLVVYADDPAAESDIPVLVRKLGQELVSVEKEGNVFKFMIRIVRKVGGHG